MKGKNKQDWIEKGYQLLSVNGFVNVTIELIARNINKNKSSFYHYFGDWEVFEEELLNYHLTLARGFAVEINECKNIDPEVIDVFLQHKTDIFFHKQLRINREKPQFNKCFLAVFELFEDALQKLWIEYTNLENQQVTAAKTLSLASENFLLQITDENYTEEWLKRYFAEIVTLIHDLKS